jgi:hypothetical protein
MTAGLYVARTFLNPILSNLADPDKEKHEQARQRAKAHLERMNRRQQDDDDYDDDSSSSRRGPRVEELVLNEYENLVALEMVPPQDISVGFDGEFCHLCRTMLTCKWIAMDELTKLCRYRWPGYDHRGTQGVCHLSSDDASSLFARRAPSLSTFWRLAVWTTWVRQDHVGQGCRSRERSIVYQPAHFHFDREVVWRLQQDCQGRLLFSSQDAACHHFHRRN